MNYSKNGYGIKISKLGDKYEGEFKLNKKEGIGTYCWSNYSIYEGEVKNNFRDGFGIINIKENGRMIKEKVLEYLKIKMEISPRESLKIIKKKDMAFVDIKMEISIKDSI